MIYYQDEKCTVRRMIETDPEVICREEIAQGWHATEEKYKTRLADDRAGKSIALVAEYEGQVAGYINIYLNAIEVDGKRYDELVDFGVLEKFRRRGIGTILMDTAEQIVSETGDTVYLEVGLHNGYGAAQRMYVKLGYIPDGQGVLYKGEVCLPYHPCRNDDDLTLRFSKQLNQGR